MRKKEWAYEEGEMRIDYKVFLEKGRIEKFAITVSYKHGKDTWDIYRVDNYHGFLHEQKFWISREPIRLQEDDLNRIFSEKAIEVRENCYRWVMLHRLAKGV